MSWQSSAQVAAVLPTGVVAWSPLALTLAATFGISLGTAPGVLGFYGSNGVAQQSVPNDGSATPAQVAAALVASTLVKAA